MALVVSGSENGIPFGVVQETLKMRMVLKGIRPSCLILWREASKAQCNIRYVHQKLFLMSDIQ